MLRLHARAGRATPVFKPLCALGITHPQLFWTWGVFLSKSCSANPRHQLTNHWGTGDACRCAQPSNTMIVCCLLKLGSIIFFPTPYPCSQGPWCHCPGCPHALHTTMGMGRLSTGEMHQGASWEVPRTGLSLGVGMGFSAVPHGCGYPGKQGQAPGTYRHMTAKGKQQQQPKGAPRGKSQRCVGSAAPWHASWPPRVPLPTCSEPFVEVDGLQLWVFLSDPSLNFRLQAAHRH